MTFFTVAKHIHLFKYAENNKCLGEKRLFTAYILKVKELGLWGGHS